MFNTLCWSLNVIGLSSVAAWLRRASLALLARHARRWEYADPERVGGWRGGVDVPLLGTVAFIPFVEGDADPPYVFTW